jgi:hypothetical protein
MSALPRAKPSSKLHSPSSALNPPKGSSSPVGFPHSLERRKIGTYQSARLRSRAELLARVARLARKFRGREVPRPPLWTGFRVRPDAIEFWTHREHRLHDREIYLRHGVADGDVIFSSPSSNRVQEPRPVGEKGQQWREQVQVFASEFCGEAWH